MRTTLVLDDDLVAKARALARLRETSALLRAALEALIERERAASRARRGGGEPGLEPPPRRRPASA